MRRPAGRALAGQRRRQALPVRRGAADQMSCARGINAPLAPRTPRPRRLRRPAGDGRQQGGRPIAFADGGIQGELAKPVDWGVCRVATLGSAKACGRFTRFRFPRVGHFLPRVGPASPHVRFRRGAGLFCSFFFFLEEREKERGPNRQGSPSTGWEVVANVYPRVGRAVHGFSVDRCGRNLQRWRGLRCKPGLFHASTEKNACVPPAPRRKDLE